MASKTEPNGGIFFGWDLGESGYNVQMDANLKKIGRLLHTSVKNRTVTDPSTLTPANGDMHIVAAGATGAWAGKDNDIAVWDEDYTAWVFITPEIGWTAYIVAEEKLSAFKATGWSAGLAI